ncbi:methyl jasmonate esterase 1-like [Solanum stenotomum]|uniref:methyl jasmonate esterase 1-like n=1 Tax=Solanum stenotomum TaxID=172797 RepID=UPI0020D16734|nr:methyl jasmonate esterase 1-like [Solanum stenotomum]
MTTLFAATVNSAANIVGTKMSSKIKRNKMKYNISGFNSFRDQKATNHVASLSLPFSTANIVSSSQPKGGALSSTYNALLILMFAYADAILSGPNNFVLVHTGCHGAWSWYKIVELMTSSGHNVTAIDLGASGNNPKQALEIPSFFDYLSPLMEFMASLPAHKKVVLVGHSLGGLAISKAMETFPEKISSVVFVTALMPGPTLNASIVYTQSSSAVLPELDNRVTYDNGPTSPPTTLILGSKFLASNLYQLSPIKDWTMATKLVRPLYLYHAEDVSKEIVLSRKRYGSVRRVFIVATESKAFNKEFQRWMIENNPPNEVEEISDSDHMIMMSKPQQLFTTLLRIANK